MDNVETKTEKSKTACSEKSFIVSVLLCFWLGFLGTHRFYAGKTLTGILQALVFVFVITPLLVWKLMTDVFQVSMAVSLSVLMIFFKLPLFLCCCLGIWILIDFVLILIGNFKDKAGLPIKPLYNNQKGEFASLFFAILSFAFSIGGCFTLYYGSERLFLIFEWIAVFLSLIPLIYGISGVVLKNQRGAKLAGFIISIAVLLLASIVLIIGISNGI